MMPAPPALQAYEGATADAQPVVAYVTFLNAQTKIFESQPIIVTLRPDSRLGTTPLSFTIPLNSLAPREYDCQVTVLGPTGQKGLSGRLQSRSCRRRRSESEAAACARYNIFMQFLSLSRRLIEKFPPEAFTPDLMRRETARVRELYAAGILRQIWKRGDTPGATILWEAASETNVRDAIASLPIFQAGLLEIVAVVPLEPYPGFGPAV
jgi:muconolactone delta-isomerase